MSDRTDAIERVLATMPPPLSEMYGDAELREGYSAIRGIVDWLIRDMLREERRRDRQRNPRRYYIRREGGEDRDARDAGE